MAERMKAGLYWAFLKTHEGGAHAIGTAQLNNAKKTPYVYFELEITHSYNADGEAVALPEPLTREAKMWLSENAWENTEKKLLRMEFTGFKSPAVHERYVNEGFEVECKHRVDDGKTYEEWELVEWGPGAGAAKVPLDTNSIRTFDAKFKMAQNAAKKPTGKPGAPPQRKGPPAATKQADPPGDGEPAGGPGEGNDDPDDLKY